MMHSMLFVDGVVVAAAAAFSILLMRFVNASTANARFSCCEFMCVYAFQHNTKQFVFQSNIGNSIGKWVFFLLFIFFFFALVVIVV